MTVRIELHLEVVDHRFTWWAKSPDVDGLSVAADSLPSLVKLAEEAIADIWADRDEPVPAIAWSFAGDPDRVAGVERVDAISDRAESRSEAERISVGPVLQVA